MSASRLTFSQIVESSREEAARRAWGRARTASALRHALAAPRWSVSQARLSRRRCDAGKCAAIKAVALRTAVETLPTEIKVTIDDHYHVGLTSVRWQGRGRFHLPANAPIGTRRPR